MIDQSSETESERVVAGHSVGRYTRYLRQEGTGVSRARNLAAETAADSDLLVFIDDDCTAEPGWLRALIAPFADGRVAMVFGAVETRAHDPKRGFIAGWRPKRSRVLRGRLDELHNTGAMGACRAVRTSVARSVRFDEMLGPGAPLHAAEDMDFTYRVLKAGWWVAHEPEAFVTHWGLRSYEEGGTLMWGSPKASRRSMPSRSGSAMLSRCSSTCTRHRAHRGTC